MPEVSPAGSDDPVDLTPPKGLATTQFIVETWKESRRAQHMASLARAAAEKAADHALQNTTDIGGLVAEVGSLHGKVDDLGRDVRRAMRIATMPPPAPRAEAPSGINLEAFAEKVAHAAIEGYVHKDKTPEDETRAVVQDEQERLEERAAKRRADERVAYWRRVGETIVGGAGLAGAIEFAKWLVSLHH